MEPIRVFKFNKRRTRKVKATVPKEIVVNDGCCKECGKPKIMYGTINQPQPYTIITTTTPILYSSNQIVNNTWDASNSSSLWIYPNAK